MLASKKIVIVTQDSKIARHFPSDCQMEIVSSIKFLDTMLYGFVPDMIVVDSVYDVDVQQIRRNENFSYTPILILSENLSLLTHFSQMLNLPRLMLCSSHVIENQKVKKRITQILESRKSFLPPKSSASVKLSLRLIGERFNENLTRDLISKNVGTSSDYLSRVFKKEMGLNLWDYVLAVRTSEAKILLERTGLSIKDVAAKTGFTDPAYFTRVFHKEYGIAPTRIRVR
ncbi:MAG: helix-turn-helix transcriptional regulator [Treponema sp.]|nr:helix-turn-helix transcriptional regulator [Treponema sp.]